MSRALLSAVIHERHGYQVTIALSATPAPGQPLDTAEVPYQLHAAGHRLAAALYEQAEQHLARWAVDVSYARVGLELTAGESVHAAVLAAQAACRQAGIELHAAARVRPPAKAKPAAKKRARRAG